MNQDNNQISLIVKVGDRTYNLYEWQAKPMQYFEEAKAIDSNVNNFNNKEAILNYVEGKYFELILIIINKFEGKLPSPPQVKSSVSKDAIGSEMDEFLRTLTREEVFKLYDAAHYLKFKSLRRCIAAYFAATVYIGNLGDYQKKKKSLGIKHDLTIQDSMTYRNNLSFMSRST